MRLNEIHVNQSGVLQEFSVDSIPELSVIHGGHGCGKTTLVSFIADMLCCADLQTTQRPDETTIGSVRVSDSESGHSWTLLRSVSADGNEKTSVQCDENSERSAVPKPCFPDWVSHQVFQEVLCPGDQQADQFAVLTALCLETGSSKENQTEIGRAEKAMEQARGERQGTAQKPGLNQQISELEHQRNALNNELSSLRQCDPAMPAEICSIEDRISALKTRCLQIDNELEGTGKKPIDLESCTAVSDPQNLLALNQQHLRALKAELTSRRDQWGEIRDLIDQETRAIQSFGSAAGNRSAYSVRALVSRLEERMRQQGTGRSDHWHSNVEQEVAALCQFVTQQQEASQAFERRFESQHAAEASNSIHRIESQLQDQILALQEELTRANNILADSMHHDPPGCGSSWHSDYRCDHSLPVSSRQSLESEPEAVKEHRSLLIEESTQNLEESERLTARLEILRQKVTTIPSLEEIDDLQARLAEVEARMDLLVSQRETLLRTETTLQQIVECLPRQQQCLVSEVATPWLRRITLGECVRILVDSDRSEFIVHTTTSSEPLRIAQLSQQTQQQLAMVLRLALLQARSGTSSRLPLIIDDVFVAPDDERGAAAADLLRDVAAAGQQIIVLTSQEDVRERLAIRGATVYSFTAVQNSDPFPTSQPLSNAVTAPSLDFKTFSDTAEECSQPTQAQLISHQHDSHWLFYLEPQHSVSDLSGIEINELNGLTAVSVDTIDQLLTCAVKDVTEGIQSAGFFITQDRVEELRKQAVLAVCVPMLRQRDAELLVSAGIENTRQLARLRPEASFDLVRQFQQSESGRRFLRNGKTIDRQQAISWNRWALHARTIEGACAAASVRNSRTPDGVGILSSSQRSQKGFGPLRDRVSGKPESQSRVRARVSRDTRRRREIRSARRRLQLGMNNPVNINNSTGQGTELKFCLNRSNDVDAAPSIGSKTALRLVRVGVRTIHDLLESDADTLATLLDNRRITASIIEQWKSQSTLVCTIPKLRGHDARILVACGKTDAHEIGNLSPEQLFSVVQSFCETTEGARIIQDGKKPDLQEVSDWISWARRSRPLKAA